MNLYVPQHDPQLFLGEQLFGPLRPLDQRNGRLVIHVISQPQPQGLLRARNTIKVHASDGDGIVRIEIIDTGIGIPADEIGNIFDEFFRASNAKEAVKDGTGLGLSIAKQIVERHHGTIDVTSRLNEGTTFTFTLAKDIS